MSISDYHDPLTCADFNLDQIRLARTHDDALDHCAHLLDHYFGSVLAHTALRTGLREDLTAPLHDFSQRVADAIAAAYTTEALARAHAATANMFEALAAGALVAHRAAGEGESTQGVTQALATMAALEGRLEILSCLDSEGTST